MTGASGASPDGGEVEVVHQPDRQRYAAIVDGVTAGFAHYRLGDGVVELDHTVVEDAFEGRGVGSRLATAALDGARADGLRVIPSCPFIAAHIDRHPEYSDLVAAA